MYADQCNAYLDKLDKLSAYVGIADKSSVYSRCYYLDFHD